MKTENVNYSGAYAAMGVDNSVRFEQFRDNFKVEIVRLEEDELEFDMIGIDPSLANAFRRILIAEVLTSLSLSAQFSWIEFVMWLGFVFLYCLFCA